MTKKVLEQHDLEDLVDSTIDRPPTGGKIWGMEASIEERVHVAGDHH